MADWSGLQQRCQVDVIDRPLGVPDEAAKVLQPYDVLCHLRERTAMPRALIEQLPNLKMMAITGHEHRTMDMDAVRERGIVVSCSAPRPGGSQGTPELTFALMLAAMRHLAFEDRRMREGHWQSTIGACLHGRTLGIIGLGKIGQRVATIAQAFGMDVIAWSPNLTDARAAAAGVRRVEKADLFAQADIVTLHMILSERTRGLVGADELALMKPTATIVNTSRGPLIEELALKDALQNRRIACAGIDVYWSEPLAADHWIRSQPNTVITPHLGYVVEESFRAFYEDTVANVQAWLDGKPVRVVS
ncbi:MAG: D-2-hydroxyacid dehydrogenase family protein [Hyphomicrobiales bacterium]|nr:D-2-hydroxyacid dehydrogenase family protein [Hyphomicrobiales bacterium]